MPKILGRVEEARIIREGVDEGKTRVILTITPLGMPSLAETIPGDFTELRARTRALVTAGLLPAQTVKTLGSIIDQGEKIIRFTEIESRETVETPGMRETQQFVILAG